MPASMDRLDLALPRDALHREQAEGGHREECAGPGDPRGLLERVGLLGERADGQARVGDGFIDHGCIPACVSRTADGVLGIAVRLPRQHADWRSVLLHDGPIGDRPFHACAGEERRNEGQREHDRCRAGSTP